MTLAYALERHLRPNPRGPSTIFAGTVMSSGLTLGPILGRTPTPWRWPVDVFVTSVGTHAAYVVAVAATNGPPHPRQF
ncbi:MAG: hypothetical protein WBP81_17070 [Solirubrobacteraceae bacterium]